MQPLLPCTKSFGSGTVVTSTEVRARQGGGPPSSQTSPILRLHATPGLIWNVPALVFFAGRNRPVGGPLVPALLKLAVWCLLLGALVPLGSGWAAAGEVGPC
jgi:hypothetical protein